MNPQHAMHQELAAQRNAELLREAQIDDRSVQRTEVDVVLQAAQNRSPALGLVTSLLHRRRLTRPAAFHTAG